MKMVTKTHDTVPAGSTKMEADGLVTYLKANLRPASIEPVGQGVAGVVPVVLVPALDDDSRHWGRESLVLGGDLRWRPDGHRGRAAVEEIHLGVWGGEIVEEALSHSERDLWGVGIGEVGSDI